MLGSGELGRTAAGLALLASAGAGGGRWWAMSGTAAGGGRRWRLQKQLINLTKNTFSTKHKTKTQLKTRIRSVLLTNHVHKKCDFAKQNKSKTKNVNLKNRYVAFCSENMFTKIRFLNQKKQKQKSDNLKHRSVAFSPKYVFTKNIVQHRKDDLKIVRRLLFLFFCNNVCFHTKHCPKPKKDDLKIVARRFIEGPDCF